MNTRLTRTAYGVVVALLAIAYAIYTLHGFWKMEFLSSAGVLNDKGKVHAMLWTLGPPLYFFVEYWVLSKCIYRGDAVALAEARVWQEMAKPIWAGILAAMLALYGK